MDRAIDLLDTIKQTNMEVPLGEEREKGAESLFKEIIVENFPNLEKQTSRSRKPKECQKKMNLKRPTLKHIKLNFQKLKGS